MPKLAAASKKVLRTDLQTWRMKNPGRTHADGMKRTMSQKTGAGARTSMNRWYMSWDRDKGNSP
jgi:hypothetical protein